MSWPSRVSSPPDDRPVDSERALALAERHVRPAEPSQFTVRCQAQDWWVIRWGPRRPVVFGAVPRVRGERGVLAVNAYDGEIVPLPDEDADDPYSFLSERRLFERSPHTHARHRERHYLLKPQHTAQIGRGTKRSAPLDPTIYTRLHALVDAAGTDWLQAVGETFLVTTALAQALDAAQLHGYFIGRAQIETRGDAAPSPELVWLQAEGFAGTHDLCNHRVAGEEGLLVSARAYAVISAGPLDHCAVLEWTIAGGLQDPPAA